MKIDTQISWNYFNGSITQFHCFRMAKNFFAFADARFFGRFASFRGKVHLCNSCWFLFVFIRATSVKCIPRFDCPSFRRDFCHVWEFFKLAQSFKPVNSQQADLFSLKVKHWSLELDLQVHQKFIHWRISSKWFH